MALSRVGLARTLKKNNTKEKQTKYLNFDRTIPMSIRFSANLSGFDKFGLKFV